MFLRRLTLFIILSLLAAWLFVYRTVACEAAGPPGGPAIVGRGMERWLIERNEPGAAFGQEVELAGDVNGDGYADLLVSGFAEVVGSRVYAYYGSPSGLGDSPDWTANNDQPDSYFGLALASAGDVNGNGTDDVAIGAPGYSRGESGEGIVLVSGKS